MHPSRAGLRLSDPIGLETRDGADLGREGRSQSGQTASVLVQEWGSHSPRKSIPQILGAPAVFQHQNICLVDGSGTWNWPTHSPKSELKVPDPLSSAAALSTTEIFGSFAGFPGRQDNNLPPALGFWLYLRHEGSRLLERGEWLLIASAVSN